MNLTPVRRTSALHRTVAGMEDLDGAIWDPTAGCWIVGEKSGLLVALHPYMFTTGLLIGRLTLASWYTDRWCYATREDALAAALAWTGEYPATEPGGWHRHPATGRRREGDREWIHL